jgi:GH15 family glucan-1,4-alpha-glucosidase
MMANRYAPIEDHGIIGDLHTVALVGKNGSIDFLCLPSFGSPLVFAALLDADCGGRFQIGKAPLELFQGQRDQVWTARWRTCYRPRRPVVSSEGIRDEH